MLESTFPEAQAFKISVQTDSKKPIFSKPQCARSEVPENFCKRWFCPLTSVHIFVRSLMSNVIMLDMIEYPGNVALFLQLHPIGSCSDVTWQFSVVAQHLRPVGFENRPVLDGLADPSSWRQPASCPHRAARPIARECHQQSWKRLRCGFACE